MLGKPAEVSRLRTFARNGQRDDILSLFAADPSSVVRAWTAAQLCDEKKRREVTNCLSDLLCELQTDDLARFVEQELLVDVGWELQWPAIFYRQAPRHLLVALPAALETCNANLERLCSFSLWMIGSKNPAWEELLCCNGDHTDPRVREQVGLLEKVFSYAFINAKLPLPACGSFKMLDMKSLDGKVLFDRDARHEVVMHPLDDPKYLIDFEPVEWEVPSLAACKRAGDFVTLALDSFLMPSECVSAILDLAEQREKILSEIVAMWGEIRSSISDAPVRNLKRWIPGEGLFQVQIKIEGRGKEDTGITPMTLFPQPNFPELEVLFGWDMWGLLATERETLDEETGLLGSVTLLGRDTSQWALRLLINHTLVRELYRIAFEPGYCREGEHAANTEDETPKLVTRAVFPHFRRLPQWAKKASDEAKERARKMAGQEPPAGYTFAASPPMRTREDHPELQPIVLELNIGC